MISIAYAHTHIIFYSSSNKPNFMVVCVFCCFFFVFVRAVDHKHIYWNWKRRKLDFIHRNGLSQKLNKTPLEKYTLATFNESFDSFQQLFDLFYRSSRPILNIQRKKTIHTANTTKQIAKKLKKKRNYSFEFSSILPFNRHVFSLLFALSL